MRTLQDSLMLLLVMEVYKPTNLNNIIGIGVITWIQVRYVVTNSSLIKEHTWNCAIEQHLQIKYVCSTGTC